MQNELGIVHTHVERPPADSINRISRYSVATIHEAQGRVGIMRPNLRPVYPTARLSGPAITVLLQPGDNWMLHVAAEQVRPGDVVVASCISGSTDGYFGELLATSLRARGAVGIVIEGGVRDTRDLAEMDFPTFSSSISARGTVKASLGAVNVPIVCGGAIVNPGDVVVADNDGVVVVGSQRVDSVAGACEDREAQEAIKRKEFENGRLGLDVYDMRRSLADRGLRYIP